MLLHVSSLGKRVVIEGTEDQIKGLKMLIENRSLTDLSFSEEQEQLFKAIVFAITTSSKDDKNDHNQVLV